MFSPTKLDAIDALIRRRLGEQQVPGASVAIVQHDQILFNRGYGQADIENHVTSTPDTLFQIASLTKQFTAMLILMLAEDHMFHFNDPITKWFPEGIGRWDMVTIYHLVSHTSGISDKPMDELDDQRDYTEDEMVLAISSMPLQWPPGTKWEYCNSAFVLLGILVGRATGKFWGEVMRERIFDPLGMKTARVIDEVTPFRAIGYEMVNGVRRAQRKIAPSLNTFGDGGLLMSTTDFCGWSAGLGTDILLPQKVLRQVWEPVTFRDRSLAGTEILRFGLGWILPTYKTLPRVAQHEGAWQGFSTYTGRLLEEGHSVVVMTNQDDSISKPAVIGRELLRMIV